MAAITDLMQTYDMATTADYSLAEGVHMISPSETPLQLILAKVQVSEIKAEWLEDQLQPDKTHNESTCEATDTAHLHVHTGDGVLLFNDTIDTVIRCDQEYMLVTAVSTDTITVTRGYGSTTAATHAAGSIIHIVGQMEHEGADAKPAIAKVRTRPSNYVQTFSRTVEVSGVQEAIKKLGGITSEVDYQIMIAMRQLALELEKTLVMGVKSQVGDGSSAYRTMGGLWAMLTSNRTSDSGAIDTTAIEADIRTMWEAGGVPRAIVCTGKMAQEIANLYSSRVVTNVESQLGGINITSIINPLGTGPIAIVPHRQMAAGEYFTLDTSKIALGYLRPFFMDPLAKVGDAEMRWIGGDYTLEVINEAAHTYRYGLT